MNQKIVPGVVNRLKIERVSDHGLFLRAENAEEVLLPGRYVSEDMHLGEEIDCFVYFDSEDRPVATTERPLAMRGEFAYLKIVDTTKFGAFADWGLSKDLLIPKGMQKNPLKRGEKRILHIGFDAKSGRLVADTRIGRYLDRTPPHHLRNHRVNLLVVAKTPMGYKTIVENRYEGMLYHNELFETLHIGQQRDAYVKKVRKDGKLDLTINPPSSQKEAADTERIRSLLIEHGGRLPFTYKSDAKAIHAYFMMSKKRFKHALTKLLESNMVELDESGINMLK